MATSSLGLLGHEACYAAASSYPPPEDLSYCFFPPDELVADSGAAVMEFPPPAVAMADYFLPEIVGARATDCCYYASPPAPVFATGCGAAAEIRSYVDDADGRSMVVSRSGGNGGGGGGRPSRRIGFRTRSEVDVLDDGFKWRKYGKKAVKSSPNPRNYYRCSAEACGVKKRVERDRDDPRYVVTTYDGVHNHAAPGSGGAGGAYCCLAPPRAAQIQGVPPRHACSAPLVAAPWSAPCGAPCDAWGTHAVTAAHSSESS